MKSFRLFLALSAVLLFLGDRSTAAADSLTFVKDGQTDFGLYVKPPVSRQTDANIKVFQDYIRQISGADISVANDNDRKAHRVIFEIGASGDPKLNVAGLGHDGFRIKTADGNLYLAALTEYGIQNAVYTFLETYLGCRMFSPTVAVVPKRRTIVLPHIDDTQVPLITFRMQDFHYAAYNAWHKLNSNEDFGLFVHTFNTLVPPAKYFADHPEYYSMLNGKRTASGQLCLSNPDVFRIVVDELRSRMRAKPEATFWSVSQNDTYVPCACPACRAIDSAEGSPSGSILGFVNRVADEFPDKTISTLAYQYSRSAPKHLKPRPNVNIMLCSIECNRSRPLADDSTSASFVKDVEDWSRLTHNIFLWDYVIQFRNLVSPFPNLQVLQPNIRFFAHKGITSVFEQGLSVMHGEFAELRSYLIAKMLWNPDINSDSVMNDFLHGFYGEAAPFIRQYIDTMHTAMQTSGEGLDIYGYPIRSVNGYLSRTMLAVYNDIFDRAEKAVSAEPEFLDRVRTSRLPLQFALLEQAKVAGAGDGGCFVRNANSNLTIRPDIDTLLTIFVSRCKEAAIPRLWEHGTSPDEYFTSTRAFLDGSTKDHLARGKTVTLALPASPKYQGGDQSALTDGLKGWDDYHMHWLGFEGEDMEATIDLGALQTVATINTDFLQDINSWIFMPQTVEFSLSEDGRDFHAVGKVTNPIPPDKDGALIAPFNAKFEPSRARYIRVKAVGMKTCPVWHKGAGGKAWIFIDEITVHQES